MIKAVLIDPETGQAIHIDETSFGKVLATTSPQKEHSHFKAITFTVQGSTTIVTPDADGSIEITDLIMTGEEKALGSITIQFNDGTNTAVITVGYVATRTLNVHMPFQGKVQGWQSAYVQATVAGDDFAGSVTLVYVKHNKENSSTYSDWEARR